MTYFKDIINPVIFDGGKNIYAAGFSIKDGKIKKIKIYNKKSPDNIRTFFIYI